jgi:hypothetical protein
MRSRKEDITNLLLDLSSSHSVCLARWGPKRGGGGRAARQGKGDKPLASLPLPSILARNVAPALYTLCAQWYPVSLMKSCAVLSLRSQTHHAFLLRVSRAPQIGVRGLRSPLHGLRSPLQAHRKHR